MNRFGQTIAISPDVISQEVLLGETVLMDVKTLAYFGLDSLGSAIWLEMQSCSDVDDLFDKISQSSDFATEHLRAKFSQILQGLAASRLIVLTNH